jgi:hypothetical protein
LCEFVRPVGNLRADWQSAQAYGGGKPMNRRCPRWAFLCAFVRRVGNLRADWESAQTCGGDKPMNRRDPHWADLAIGRRLATFTNLPRIAARRKQGAKKVDRAVDCRPGGQAWRPAPPRSPRIVAVRKGVDI